MLSHEPCLGFHPSRLNVSEAAAYTGISASTLNKLRVFGGGAVYTKIGRRVVYEIAALDSWLSTKQRHSTSDTGEARLSPPKVGDVAASRKDNVRTPTSSRRR